MIFMFKKNLVAGIITYNPNIERLLEVVNSIRCQVDEIYIYDNGSKNNSDLHDAFCEIRNIKIIDIEKNVGIAEASNQMCEYAINKGYEWILILDHDTICPKQLVSTYMIYTNDIRIGIICPSVLDKDITNNRWKGNNTVKIEYVERCIQSATMVRLESWKKVGGYDSWMFIDFVDFDFCKKLQLANYKILRCNTVEVDHKLGQR